MSSNVGSLEAKVGWPRRPENAYARVRVDAKKVGGIVQRDQHHARRIHTDQFAGQNPGAEGEAD